ncbi:MAG: arsenate reductase ArsC [Rhodobacteraceae bacterium]|nr:arsenate reductase ArsC [Paracoccaceae bacterium]
MLASPRNVLFLCTGNSARSIMSEAILRKTGEGRFNVFSAGSQPAGYVNRFAIEQIASHGMPTDGFRSKSWDEFAAPDAPNIDIVITVCGNAASETCPVFPGKYVRAHWGIPDPAPIEGNTARMQLAFAQAYDMLAKRIAKLVALSDGIFENRDALQAALDEIGEA